MAKSTVEKSSVRLKTVLDVLAEGTWSEKSLNAGEVLAEAIVRVPLDAREAELLSGGIPRGHKSLTTATAKLVKAGWLIKGRSGWTITEDGLRATVAFAKPEEFTVALAEGTPVPAETPLPTAPAKKAPARKAAAKKVLGEAAPAEVAEANAATAKATPKTDVAPKAASAVDKLEQPAAVAIAGDFNKILGAPEDWAPQYDEAQMKFNSRRKVWTLATSLPAGFYTYKIALNRSWDENYGAFGVRDGANHELHHDGGKVTFTYDHSTRDIVTA
ncbi:MULTISPECIES: glycosidase [Arthrobacter]|uniref:Glycosidase n=1 Tax=Arthrobacter terricola TaxID=2547396 RepID=A0A4R5KJK1_9MICC|nr:MULTISPECIES: glycosidase [Arthrobacter]MBT8161665.1 glycosidase [Arthrobacter sp. GN70]TDF95322.1 glycosidase [Arthrobacter terricola]